ncbi:serine/threonine-protein kinase [Planotetraspora mira]|uniref:serine/threonine-protein kinase n=1 Tax=Planotetraspora mira TaxID=58121 RepID=UPI0019518AD0|nr:serine/threonine-protein kinase [Planotetraspora mira]
MGTDRAGDLLGDRYRLVSPFHREDGGVMWRAHDLRLKRDVVVREVRPPAHIDGSDLPAARLHALGEARSAARLAHPAIVTVHDLLEDHGRIWMVTELLRGLTLKETVRHLGRLPIHWAAWVGFQLLAGIRYAHAAEVLHDGIRPSRVLLTEERVVLTGFGFATPENMPAATAPSPYTAPERLLGRRPDQASDLWSFAATLYYGVEGRPPYPADEVRSGRAGEPEAVTAASGAYGDAGSAPEDASADRHGGSVLTADDRGEPDPPRKAGPLRPVLEGLLRVDPDRRLTAEAATALLVELLKKEGIAATLPGRRAESPLPPSFTK